MSTQSQSIDKDKITLTIAIIVLGAFFLFYGITLGVSLTSPPPADYSGIEEVASTLGPIAAAVIGYYFGQRLVPPLQQQLQNVTTDANVGKQGVQESLDTFESARSEADRLNKIIEKQQQLIAELTRGKP